MQMASRKDIFNYCLQQAEAGKVAVAEYYRTGKYTLQDYNKAFYWAKKAVDSKTKPDNLPLHFLGYCYQSGCGITKDITKAIHYYEMAANYCHQPSIFALAKIYFHGDSDSKTTIVPDHNIVHELISRRQISDAEKYETGPKNFLQTFSINAGTGLSDQEVGELVFYKARLTHEQMEILLEMHEKCREAYSQSKTQLKTLASQGRDEKIERLENSISNAQNAVNQSVRKLNDRAEKILQIYHRSAELGYAPAYLALGKIYGGEFPTHKNAEVSQHWFKEGADALHPECMYQYATCLMSKQNGKPHAQEVIKLLTGADEKGFHPAAALLANIYNSGLLDIIPNQELAAAWQEKAARQNKTEPQGSWWQPIFNFFTTPYNAEQHFDPPILLNSKFSQEPANIAKCFLDAEKGEPGAMYNAGAGLIFGKSHYFEQDPIKAFGWFKLAASKQHAEAAFILFISYILVNKDTAFYVNTISNLKSIRDCTHSSELLKILQTLPIEIGSICENDAIKYLQLAADHGFPTAQLIYAELLEKWSVFEDNALRTLALCNDILNKDPDNEQKLNGQAHVLAGKIYLKGSAHIIKNPQRACEHFINGLNLENAECIYMLGRMFERGSVVTESETTALALYRRAAALGNQLAAESLSSMRQPIVRKTCFGLYSPANQASDTAISNLTNLGVKNFEQFKTKPAAK
jgi:TPR repeat protein